MNTYNLKAGQKVLFTINGKEFKIEKVTDKRVSWYVGFEFKQGSGKKTYRMTWITMEAFNKGVENGSYKLI